MRRAIAFLVLFAAVALAVTTPPTAGQGGDDITIVHSPPSVVAPGTQIYITAILSNATSAVIAWQNTSMDSEVFSPMTNLSLAQSGGWLYAAYLPAQPSPTQVRYAINATGPSGSHLESYFLSVDVPTPEGISEEQQQAWILTMVASLSMATSLIAMMYWYTGRRLRRGA